MRRIFSGRRIWSTLLSVTLLGSLCVAGFGSASVALAADTYGSDMWDQAPFNDDLYTTAQNITPIKPGWGGVLVQDHTFDVASAVARDDDWFRLSITPQEVGGVPDPDPSSWLIEAMGRDLVNPVIEVYGPAPLTVPPTDPLVLIGGGFDTDLEAGHPDCVAASDGSPWGAGVACDFPVTIDPGQPGTYYIRVRPAAFAGGYNSAAGRYTFRIRKGLAVRAAGANRIETSIEIRKERFPTSAPNLWTNSVVLTDADNFPDALAGGTLFGPILLTPSDSLPAEVAAEIARVNAGTIYVLGGTAAVSQNVYNQAQAASPASNMQRVGGATRVETAVEIAKLLAPWNSKLAIIAYAYNFPDALAATPFSASNSSPILLTGSASLDPVTEAALSTLGITDVVIVGGPAVISPAVESRLRTLLGSGHVLRIGGSDRYDTAKDFSAWAAGYAPPGTIADATVGTAANPTICQATDPHYIGFASGENFPDALAGGAFTGIAEGVMLLTRPDELTTHFIDPLNQLPPGEKPWFDLVQAEAMMHSYVFGGPAAISDDVYEEILHETGLGVLP